MSPHEPTSDWPVERLLAADYGERAFLLTAADQSNRIEDVPIRWDALVASADSPDTHVRILADGVRLARDGQPVTADRLDAWQAAILREQAAHGRETIPEEWIGRMRAGRCEVWVGVQRRHRGTPARWVAERMAEYLHRLEEQLGSGEARDHPVRLLAHSHLEFQDIHPYLDGTGRTARALALYVAVRLGVAPVLFSHADRARTYDFAFWDRTGRAMERYCARHQLAHDPFAASRTG